MKYILLLAIISAVTAAKCDTITDTKDGVSISEMRCDDGSIGHRRKKDGTVDVFVRFSGDVDFRCAGTDSETFCLRSDDKKCTGKNIMRGKGDNTAGHCCAMSDDCKDTCKNGICGKCDVDFSC
jgi:hypothetical protein